MKTAPQDVGAPFAMTICEAISDGLAYQLLQMLPVDEVVEPGL